MGTKSKKPKAEKEKVITILDGAYELVNMEAIKVSTGIGEFDLDNLSIPSADRLIAAGCKWIRKAENS